MIRRRPAAGEAWALCLLALSLGIARAQVSTNALSPADELASFRLADDQLTIELIAAEPAGIDTRSALCYGARTV